MAYSHKRAAAIVGACAGLFVSAQAALAQSDTCSGATPIGVGSYSGSTSGASSDGSTTCGVSSSSPDEWFSFTPTEDGALTVSLCGSSYDTVISVHSGCPGGSSNTIACNDDSCGLQSELTTQIDGFETVYIRVSGWLGNSGSYSLDVSFAPGGGGGSGGVGPDVIVGSLPNESHYGSTGGVHAYSLGTTSCNIGDENLDWISSTNRHPVIAQNMYRLANGRFEMVGMSWLKHGFVALTGNLCDSCNGQGGSVLGVGCSDPYGSGLNGSQGNLGPRFEVNATTGVFSYPFTGDGQTGNTIYKRIQVAESDLTTPGASYFMEGHYITQDDAQAGNGLNNASYRPVNVNAGFSLTLTGSTVREDPAIAAWAAADATVDLNPADYNETGITARFWVGAKATDVGGGVYEYEYAVFNLNSDRSGGSFSVPADTSESITDIGFHDVPYHSGEPYNSTDWTGVASNGAVTWSTAETFAQNPNANALRWSTLYNFRFRTTAAPSTGDVTIGLFKPGGAGDPDDVSVTTIVPTVPTCAADWNGDGNLNTNDFVAYLNDYNAVVGGGTWTFNDPDIAAPIGVVNTADFIAFLNLYGAGCN